MPLDTVARYLHTIAHRGGDGLSVFSTDGVSGGFTRLAIQDVSGASMQPLHRGSKMLLYNGELYGQAFETSDGPELLRLLDEYGPPVLGAVYGEYAGVLYDFQSRQLTVFRDATGVRPLFTGRMPNGTLCFASEAKALDESCSVIAQVPPNTLHKFDYSGKLVSQARIHPQLYSQPPSYCSSPWDRVRSAVRLGQAIVRSVRMRCRSDRPVGCFLSGGLDSSLVATLVARERRRLNMDPPRLYTVAFDTGSTDLPQAQAVADALGLPLTVIRITLEEAANALFYVVQSLESACVTTVRASTPMWLMCKWIKSNTDTRVLFSGEGADELAGGYRYFLNAPSAMAANDESVRLLKNLHLYDNLRVDRCAAAFGLEVRIPLLDHAVIRTYRQMSMRDMNAVGGIEKRALRRAAALLMPDSPVVWRQKEALSDGAGYGWVDWLRERFGDMHKEHMHYTTLLYGLGRYGLVKQCWMPQWSESTDPSARFLNKASV